MTAASGLESGDQPTRSAGRGRPRRLRWWVAGITFVVGFVFGIVAVGLLGLTTPEFGTGVGPGGSAPGPTGPPDPGGSVPVVAEARVNAACLAVINHAQDTYIVLTGLDEAVTDVDLQQLDDIVRRLQPIEARLGRDLQDCRVDTNVGGPGEAVDPGSPTPGATASPTR